MERMQLPFLGVFARKLAEMSLKKEKRQLQMFELNLADLLDPNNELLRNSRLFYFDYGTEEMQKIVVSRTFGL